MEVGQILEGWRNKVAPREELKELIERVYNDRIKQCNNCDWYSLNKKKIGWTTIRIDEHCTQCGCTTSAKLRCLSCECPLAKWKAITTIEIENEIKNNSK